MKRFLILNYTDGFNTLIKDLILTKFKYIKNIYTGGDDDIIVIDTLYKCFTYGEHGSNLVSDYFLDQFQDSNITLSELITKSTFS
jgi:hypothetical protein